MGQANTSAGGEHVDMHNCPRSGRPRSAQMGVDVEKVNSIIMADRHITVRELSHQLDIGEVSMCRMVKQLGYAKVCAVVHLFNIDIHPC